MQQEKLTIKSQEALHAAQRLAEKLHHTEVDVEHLLLALVGQEDGVVPPLLEKLGVARASLQHQIEQILAKRATVEDGA
jgi:ATP-dependent Clp protease ATP-binding subunit ClpB